MTKKICSCFKNIYAIFIGLGIIAVISLVTSFYNEIQTDVSVNTQTSQYIEFPENQEMLKDMAEKLAKEGAYLSDIMPAAGDAE